MSEGDDRDDRENPESDGESLAPTSPHRPGSTQVSASRVRWTRAQLLEINDRLQGAVRELGAENNALTEQNVALTERNARLEQLVSESIRQLMNRTQCRKYEYQEARQEKDRLVEPVIQNTSATLVARKGATDLSSRSSSRLCRKRVLRRVRALCQLFLARRSGRRLDVLLGPFVGG